jgi:DNA-binding LytR/AlgR family response regulator
MRHLFLVILLFSQTVLPGKPHTYRQTSTLLYHHLGNVNKNGINFKQFYRANRQFIINLEALHTVKPVENSKLIIRLKEPNHKLEIDMSRVKSPEFKKWLDS